jgi:hypothetical protein
LDGFWPQGIMGKLARKKGKIFIIFFILILARQNLSQALEIGQEQNGAEKWAKIW